MTEQAGVVTKIKVDDSQARRRVKSLSAFIRNELGTAFGRIGATTQLTATTTDVENLRKSINRLNTTTEQSAKNTSDFAKQVKRLGTESKKAADDTKKAGQSIKDTAEQTSTLKVALGGIEGAFLKVQSVMFFVRQALDLVKAGFNFAKEGAQITQTAISFDNFATSVIQMPDLLDRLNQAASGTISEFELMQSTLTLVAGTTPEVSKTLSEAFVGAGDFSTSLIDVARAAQILNPALGDVDFFLKSLSIGIKRNEKRWIDNTGVLISSRVAFEKHAEVLGISAQALTEEQKQVATLNETLRVGALLVDQIGDQTDSLVDPFKRAEVAFEEFGNTAKVAFFEAILPIIEGFNEFANGADQYSTAIDQIVDDNLDLATSSEKTADEQVKALADFLRQVEETRRARPILAALFFGEEIKRARIETLTELAQFAGDVEGSVALINQALAGSDQRERERIESTIRGFLGDEGVFTPTTISGEALVQQFAEIIQAQKQAATEAEAAEQAFMSQEGSLFRLVDRYNEAIVSSRELETAQNTLRNNLEGVADTIITRQVDAYKQLAQAQEELATATGDNVAQAADKVNDIAQQIQTNYREMATTIFEATGQSEEAVLRFQESLGLIDSATVENILSVRQVEGAMQDLFVLINTDPAFEDLKTDYDTLAAASVLLTQGQIDLSRGLNVAALEAIAQVQADEQLKEQLLAIAQSSDTASESQDKLADNMRKITNEAIKAAGNLTEYGQAILDAGQAAGLSSRETIDLAEATGLLSREEAQSARNAIIFQVALQNMTAAVEAGTLSEKEMIAESIRLAKALGIDLTGAAADATKAALEMSSAFSSSFVDELTRSTRSTGGFTGAAQDARRQIQELNKEFNSYFLSALKGEEQTDNLSLQLFELAAQGGASAEELALLAGATGEFSEEQIKAALASAQLQTAVRKIADALLEGEITAEQAEQAIGGLQQQLDETGAINLGELGIPDVARRAEDAATASSGAAEQTESWADKLVDLAAQGGASAQEVAILALATGEYSEEAIQGALKTAVLQQAIGKVAQAFADGNITAGEAVQIIQDFRDGLDEEFSLEFNASGIENSIGLIDELTEKLDNIPEEVDVDVNLRANQLPIDDLGGGTGGGTGAGAGQPPPPSGGGGVGGPPFHTGGIVPGARGVEVPTTLLAGEGVIRTEAMSSPNVPQLVNTLNAGAPPGFTSALGDLMGGFAVSAPTTTINNTTTISTDASTSTTINNNTINNPTSLGVQPVNELGAIL